LGVVEIARLTYAERKRVHKEKREENGPEVQVIEGGVPPTTNTLFVGLYKRKDTGKMYLTAFPGEVVGAPPLPSGEQTATQRPVSEAYWKRMVLFR
jgi:hypothetical protein